MLLSTVLAPPGPSSPEDSSERTGTANSQTPPKPVFIINKKSDIYIFTPLLPRSHRFLFSGDSSNAPNLIYIYNRTFTSDIYGHKTIFCVRDDMRNLSYTHDYIRGIYNYIDLYP